MLAMAGRATRAFHEYMPIRGTPAEPGRVYRKLSYGPLLDVFMLDTRSYRGPSTSDGMEDSYGPATYFFGPQQIAWLKRSLKESKAVWKVIACDMPVSLKIVYDTSLRTGIEGLAQGDNGQPRGRELELADILSFLRRERIRNTFWITADVHYAAAHYFDPNKAAFQEFDPFWEFIAGPLHAGSGTANDPDQTFGAQVMFRKAGEGPAANRGPWSGRQFFGHVSVDGATEVATVTLRDIDDNALWSGKLEPVRA